MNFRTLDLNLLRVFDAVMAEGSLTRAAANLAMTQPAVSQALRRLRLAADQDLFVRTAHGVRPTPYAQGLWPQVRDALATLRQALSPSEFDPTKDAVQFRVAMADATAALLAPPLVDHIEREGVQVNLRVLPLTTRDPRQLLEQDEADLAVGFFPEVVASIQAQGADGTLRCERIYDTRYVCAMRRNHPLATQPLTLDAFCAADHLLVSFSGRPYGFTDQALSSLGRQRRIVLTVNQFFTAGLVVKRSNLLTVLPEHFMAATGSGDNLITRELPFPMPPVHVAMLWHLRREHVGAHRWLRHQVMQATALPVAQTETR